MNKEKILKLLQKRKERLNNKAVKTLDEFVDTQNKLNELDFKMLELNDNHIPHID